MDTFDLKRYLAEGKLTSESLDYSIDLEWRGDEDDWRARFRTSSGELYEIVITANYLTDPDRSFYNFVYKSLNENDKGYDHFMSKSYHLEFTHEDGQGVTGTGNASEVFGIVINGAVAKAKEMNMSALWFSGAKDGRDQSRRRLYKVLVQKIAAKLGFDYASDNANGYYIMWDKKILQK